jgi:hypothetical protein
MADVNAIDFAGSEQAGLDGGIAIAGAEEVETGSGKVVGSTPGVDVEEADPEVEVGYVGGEIDVGVNFASDFGVGLEWRGVKEQDIVAAGEGLVIVSSVGVSVGVGEGMGGIGEERGVGSCGSG